MIHLPKNETKLMVAVHGWSGILLGLVLYAVVLTGTAAVFAEEIGIWSSGHMSSTSAFERPVGQNVQALGSQTPTKYHEGVDLFEVGDHDLGAFFHRHEIDPDGELVSRGIFYRVNSNGQVIDRQAGTSEEVFGPRNDDALSHFLVDTHVRLHLPNPWGLLLTGILGLAMLVAAVSGLMIHRHLFKDIFTLRRKANPVLFNRDRHSVAGTWSLPFAFILAFTGSFFSFFGTVGVPIVAMAAFGGDVQALNSSVFGNPGQADPRPAPTSGVDRITRDAIQRTGEIPTFVTIENFGRADAKVTTFHPPEKGGVLPTSLLYDGADGRFEQVKPLIGTKPSAGGRDHVATALWQFCWHIVESGLVRAWFCDVLCDLDRSAPLGRSPRKRDEVLGLARSDGYNRRSRAALCTALYRCRIPVHHLVRKRPFLDTGWFPDGVRSGDHRRSIHQGPDKAQYPS